MSRIARVFLAAALGAATLVALPTVHAEATVSAFPASWTPQITTTDARVRKLAQCGSTMYAVGVFGTVRQGGKSYVRHNAFSFNAKNGALTSWNPNVSGKVESIALSPDCSVAYLGGSFTKIGSTSVRNIAAVSASTGAVRTGFKHNANGMVHTVAVVNGGRDLLVGGAFTSINGTARPYYASLDPGTGSVNSYLQVTVAGHVESSSTMVFNQQLSPSGTRLLFEGTFTTVSGMPRVQLAELDLGSAAATLDGFYSARINSTSCVTPFYIRAAAFSPDEKTVYIATTGFVGSSPYCDAAVAFPNTPGAADKWINKTGGDSLYSVAAGPFDVYIGGHERWADNPFGQDSCGAGCVPRQGIGDISATSGLATSWNPTRARGKGADDLLITPDGLWVASDTFFNSVKCGGIYHPGICFFPGTA